MRRLVVRCAVERKALAGEGNNTGDIAHLEARPSISLFVRYVNTYFRFLFAQDEPHPLRHLFPDLSELPPSAPKSILP